MIHVDEIISVFVADSDEDLFVSCCDEASHQVTFCDTLRLAAGLFFFFFKFQLSFNSDYIEANHLSIL